MKWGQLRDAITSQNVPDDWEVEIGTNQGLFNVVSCVAFPIAGIISINSITPIQVQNIIEEIKNDCAKKAIIQ